jgi:cell wall assembly regulator SMI1
LRGDVLRLPSIEEQNETQEQGRRRLGEWLRRSLTKSVRVYSPATEAQISAFEGTVGGALPALFREFLMITDGLDSDTIRVNGTTDLYEIEGAFPGILVAWDSDSRDDFVVVLAHDGYDQRTYRINIGDPGATPVALATDFREYLRARLKG